MIAIEKIFELARDRDASDIHLIPDLKPILRITRDLIPIEEFNELTDEDMWEIYDYFVSGNVEKDEK